MTTEPEISDEQIEKYFYEEGEELTTDPEHALFILRNGAMISDGAQDGVRGTDHNALTSIAEDVPSTDPQLWSKLHARTGVVRMVPETRKALIMEGQALTAAQQDLVKQTGYTVEAYTPPVATEQEETADLKKSLRVTKEDIQRAKQVSILDIAAQNGIELKRDGHNQYRGVEHSSLVVTVNANKYIWNAQHSGGTSIDFVMKIVGINDFKEAVRYLNSPDLKPTVSIQPEKPRKPFVYEIENSPSFQRARSYLTTMRGINPNIVDALHAKGFIQQDTYGNCIFVWAEHGKPAGASIQGTTVNHKRFAKRGTYKQIADDSKENFGWNFSVGNPTKLLVFEAPIDALSYLSEHPQTQDTMFFAMDGLKPKSFVQAVGYMRHQYGVMPTEVGFGVDNDPAGHYFLDQVINTAQLHDPETGEITPYRNLMVQDLAIPTAHVVALKTAAQAAGVDWLQLAAIEKSETNFVPKKVANAFGYEQDFGASEEDYPQALAHVAGILAKHTDENGSHYDAVLRELHRGTDEAGYNAMVRKVTSYAQQYADLGFHAAEHPYKDWNDIRVAGLRPELEAALFDRAFVKISGQQRRAITVKRDRDDNGNEVYREYDAMGMNAGQIETDTPEEMAFYIKTHGFSAVDKQDVKTYERQAKQSVAANRPLNSAQQTLQNALARG